MIKKLFLAFILFASVFFLSHSEARAATCAGIATGVGVTLPEVYTPGMTHTITFNLSSHDQSKNYWVKVTNPVNADDDECQTKRFPLNAGNQSGSNSSCNWNYDAGSYTLTLTLTGKEALSSRAGVNNRSRNEHEVNLWRSPLELVCNVGSYESVASALGGECSIFVSQEGANPGDVCYQTKGVGCLQIGKPVTIEATNITFEGNLYEDYVRFIIGAQGFGDIVRDQEAIASGGKASIEFTPETGATHYIKLKAFSASSMSDVPNCAGQFTISENCLADQCNKSRLPTVGPETLGPDSFTLCTQISDSTPDGAAQKAKCIACAGGEGGYAGIWTAIGCIKRDPQAIVQKFIKVGLGMAGGIALLSFLAAGFIYSTSQGSPEKLKSAQEMMTASIIGILFVIFSVTILQFIGFSILQIPGFGG